MNINGKNLQAPPSPKPLPKQGFRMTERTVQILALVFLLSPVLVYILCTILNGRIY